MSQVSAMDAEREIARSVFSAETIEKFGLEEIARFLREVRKAAISPARAHLVEACQAAGEDLVQQHGGIVLKTLLQEIISSESFLGGLSRRSSRAELMN